MNCRMSGRVLVLLFLALSSAAVIWCLAPQRPLALAEAAPAGALFYFEIHPQSTLSAGPPNEILLPFQGYVDWSSDSLQALPAPERDAARAIVSDPATRFAAVITEGPASNRDRAQVGFMLIATTSTRHFESLGRVADAIASRALEPGFYVELEKEPRLGVIIGHPPKRLYRYQEYPFLVLANAPELITEALEVRHKGRAALASEGDYKKARASLAVEGGALLYVHLPELQSRLPSAFTPSLSALLRALDVIHWRVLVYHWSQIQGHPVKRVILLRE
jgi:hypothetical protein